MFLQKPDTQHLEFLKKTSQKIRIKVIEMIAQAKSGHPAGSLGMADIFTALYFSVLKHDPLKPDWEERDYVILSNGHICPVLYASLSKAGYFPESELASLRQTGSALQGHPLLNSAPGVENTSGPLGQGLSQACGLALAFKMDKKSNHIYCLLSDGEQQEGQTWEAYQLANKYQLDNLTAVVDRNHIQIEGSTEEIMPLGDLRSKLKSFGWKTYQIDGHDFTQIIKTLKKAKNDRRPSIIIANTIPGKGVSVMENKNEWHGKAPDPKLAQQAIKELSNE
jgi:transketolase